MPSRLLGHCLRAAVVILLVLPVSASGASQDIDRQFDVKPGQALRLDFDDMRGNIEIEGWDKNRVEINGRIGGRDWEDGDELEFDQTSSGIDASPSYRPHDDDRIKIDLKIKVPREFDIRMRGNTDTRISNLRGDIEVSIANADLELDDVHGECDISAANGHLDVKDCTLKGDVSNVNGRLTVDNSDLSGEVASVNGGMKVSRAPEGIDVSSVNGSIDVGSAKDHVQVSSVNGSVEIDELYGWLEAETVNGAVRLRMVGNPDTKRDLDIETLNGNVEIEIPENFSLEFDIEVRSEDRGARYEIISDFDLDIQSEDSRRRRYKVRGKGKIGGGRHKVHIRTTNGDVILKRVSSSG